MSGSLQIPQVRKRLWFALFAVLATFITLLGFAQYRIEKERISKLWAHELTSVGILKAEQISSWRKERLADVIRFAQGPTLTRAIAKADPADVRLMLNLNRKDEFYNDSLLVSPVCEILFSATGSPVSLGEASRRAVALALSTQRPAISDFFIGKDETIFIDAAAPVKDEANKLVAAFVLRCAATDSIYPLIESWPGPSKSAETLLVRKEENMAVILSVARHQRDLALKSKSPLGQAHNPAVQAILGKVGVVQGEDYRGVKVLADVRPIPDSDWFIVTKIDKEEILATVKCHATVISCFVLLSVFLVGSLAAFGLRHRQASIYHSLYRTEQEQRLASEKFKTILYSIGNAVITTDDHGCVTQMNPVAEKMTGWSEAEASGRPLDEVFRIIDEDTREPRKSPVWQILREGQMVALANHTTLVSRDGTEHPIADSGAPVRNGKGHLVGVVLVFRSQSVERAAQRALAKSELRLSTLMKNLPGIVYRCNMDTYWTMSFLSAGCKTLTGYDPEDLLDNKTVAFFDLIHPDDRQQVWETIDAAVRKNETYTLEYRIITADGNEKWVWERGCAINNEDGSVAELEGVIHDITDRRAAAAEQSKLAEQLHQAQKVEAIGRLASGLTHDFNNMLSLISDNVEQIKEQPALAPSARSLLGEILIAVRHSAALGRQLCGSAGKQTLTPRPLILNDTIDRLCPLLKRLVGESINVTWEPAENLWPVMMDQDQLEQVLISLAINARDAITGTGNVVIRTSNVSQYKSGDDPCTNASCGDYVKLSFSDNGCGMDAAAQTRIFEPFFTLKQHGAGTGLGMAMACDHVKQNNGFLRVVSQPGKGASFHVFLPRCHAPQNTGGADVTTHAPDSDVQPHSAAPGDASAIGQTVLLVEDEPPVRALTQNLLKRMGFKVLAAGGAAEALQLSREFSGPIHLLLSDVVMPVMCGPELCQTLLSERPGMKSLLMSGYTADVVLQHGVSEVSKNFLQETLLEAGFRNQSA